jgi:hypothetical protein
MSQEQQEENVETQEETEEQSNEEEQTTEVLSDTVVNYLSDLMKGNLKFFEADKAFKLTLQTIKRTIGEEQTEAYIQHTLALLNVDISEETKAKVKEFGFDVVVDAINESILVIDKDETYIFNFTQKTLVRIAGDKQTPVEEGPKKDDVLAAIGVVVEDINGQQTDTVE